MLEVEMSSRCTVDNLFLVSTSQMVISLVSSPHSETPAWTANLVPSCETAISRTQSFQQSCSLTLIVALLCHVVTPSSAETGTANPLPSPRACWRTTVRVVSTRRARTEATSSRLGEFTRSRPLTAHKRRCALIRVSTLILLQGGLDDVRLRQQPVAHLP